MRFDVCSKNKSSSVIQRKKLILITRCTFIRLINLDSLRKKYQKMFNKKIKCVCGKKIDVKYEFCPYCGTAREDSINNERQKKSKEDMFNKQVDSLTKELSQSFGMPMIDSFPFKMLVKKLSKDIEKQFREMDRDMSMAQSRIQMPSNSQHINIPANAKKSTKPLIKDGKKVGDVQEFNFPGGHGFSIQIQMGGSPQNITLKGGDKEGGELGEDRVKKIKLPKSRISETRAHELSKLPRHEPETKIRRMTDKLVYEISMPGVKDEKDIAINKLQNSIEIKAFSKDKAYFKLIPLAFPIKSWKLEKERLVLELKT
jgi:HSP20 family molecular chaperone IbpA